MLDQPKGPADTVIALERLGKLGALARQNEQNAILVREALFGTEPCNPGGEVPRNTEAFFGELSEFFDTIGNALNSTDRVLVELMRRLNVKSLRTECCEESFRTSREVR